MGEIFTCGVSEQMGDGSPQVRLPNNTITFRVDDDLPGFTRSAFEDMVMAAWQRWVNVIGITVDKHTNPKTTPTQIVTVFDFGDGPSGILADQQLPYGKGEGLLMRVDVRGKLVASDNPPPGYLDGIAILCHENGHCLGLSHANPGDGVADLMDPVLSSIVKPQPGDVMVARKMGYGPPGVHQPAPLKGRYIELKEQDEAGAWWTCSGYFKPQDSSKA